MRGLSGQYYPLNSPVHRMDARAKLVALLLLLAAVVSTRRVWGYVPVLAATALIVCLSRLPLSVALGSFSRLWQLFVTIFLINALFSSTAAPIFRWWIVSLSVEGVLRGVRVVVNMAVLIVLSNVLTGTTRPVALTDAIASLLRPLRFLGVPTEDVAMIVSIAIRFVPTLSTETEMIRMAQTARGARFESGRLLERAKSVLPLVVPIFLSAFKRADDLATAMEARGYRGATRRTVHRPQKLRLADVAAILICAAFAAVQIILTASPAI